MVFESSNACEHDLGPNGNHFVPGFAAWIPDGGGDQVERAASGIRSNEETLFVEARQRTGVMVRVVFVIVLAWSD